MDAQTLYRERQDFHLAPSSTLRGGLIFCIVIGVVTFIAGMFVADAPTRTWGSFIFNLFFFFSIALGGSAFAGMQDVIDAKWGRPIMRLHESFASFLPVATAMFALLFACIALKIGHANDVYVWIKDPDMLKELWGKRDWLRPGFMMTRDLGCMAIILGCVYWQMKQKLTGDMAIMGGNESQGRELGRQGQLRLRFFSAPVLVVYAICFSCLAFDITMSLAPKWNSTLWGGWSFAVMMQSLMAALLLFMYALKNTHIGQLIKRQQFHDVGKLMHGFTIFFAYVTYAHIITYWYGNVPEETEYFLRRIHGPWLVVLYIALFLVFLFPLFALLPKVSKWTVGLTVPICGSILVAQWLVALVVVIPQTIEGANWGVPWIEVGVFLGFLGLFLSSIVWFGKRYPMVSLADPLLAEALAEGQH